MQIKIFNCLFNAKSVNKLQIWLYYCCSVYTSQLWIGSARDEEIKQKISEIQKLINRQTEAAEQTAASAGLDAYYERTLSMLSSPAVRRGWSQWNTRTPAWSRACAPPSASSLTRNTSCKSVKRSPASRPAAPMCCAGHWWRRQTPYCQHRVCIGHIM